MYASYINMKRVLESCMSSMTVLKFLVQYKVNRFSDIFKKLFLCIFEN